MNISFTVYTTPQPQGSIRSFLMPDRELIERTADLIARNRNTRSELMEMLTEIAKRTRAILTSDNNDLKKYRQKISKAAKEAMQSEEPTAKHAPMEIHIEFIFVRPKSVSTKRLYPTVRPDIDKLERALLDSLTGVVYTDDDQVVDVVKSKRYGPQECVNVKAWTIDDVPTTGFLPLVAQEAPKLDDW